MVELTAACSRTQLNTSVFVKLSETLTKHHSEAKRPTNASARSQGARHQTICSCSRTDARRDSRLRHRRIFGCATHQRTEEKRRPDYSCIQSWSGAQAGCVDGPGCYLDGTIRGPALAGS